MELIFECHSVIIHLETVYETFKIPVREGISLARGDSISIAMNCALLLYVHSCRRV